MILLDVQCPLTYDLEQVYKISLGIKSPLLFI